MTPHVFRHAYAIISRENNADIYSIKRSLGHERIETTEIYLEKVYSRKHSAVLSWDSKMLCNHI
ncbi:tyrosine-type recombinase/integrase [Psychrobacillus sp. FSL K6-4046]|uniref:tyrosine-type recombinase/integrase n=1 Tax=Psychrobacillus sp. FSL K6-4046 TaxID=2921550 RepID=UPI00315A2C05